MKSGVVCLKEILQFVRAKHLQTEAYDLSAGRDSSTLGADYLRLCDEAIRYVPKVFGYYLWGFYNSSKFWVNVYLGKSGNNVGGPTTHLHYRLGEELADERAFAWRAFCEKAQVINLDPKYPLEVKRAINKAGSTHIFWVATPHIDGGAIEAIEKDLIETMNPTGNRKRVAPTATLRLRANQILDVFREMIHREDNRESAYKLEYHKEFWKWVGEADPPTP